MNAMDAMASTSMTLREVLISTRGMEGGAIEVMVKDRGQGILPADKRSLIRAVLYHQGKWSRSRAVNLFDDN